jgi:tetratricopeptide (TPR) repeat protein
LDLIALYEHTLHCFLPLYDAHQNRSAPDLSVLIGRLYMCVGVSYLRIGHFTKALAAYETSRSILQNENNPTAIALCCSAWGKSIAGHDVAHSKALLAEALALVQEIDAEWPKALIYQAIGESNLLFGNYAEAETQSTQGYMLAKQINWQRGLVSGHKALARVYLLLGHYQQAEDHLRQSIAIAHQHHFKLFYLESLTILGEALGRQGRFTEAKSCFVKSRQFAEELGAGALVAPVLWEEGCLAELCGDYRTAKERLT